MVREVWVIVLGLLCGPVFAGTWKANSVPVPAMTSTGHVTMSPGASDFQRLMGMGSRTVEALPDGGALLKDLLRLPFNPQQVESTGIAAVERKLSAKAIGAGVARALPLVGTAILVTELMEAVGCKVSLSSGVQCHIDEVLGTTTEPYQYGTSDLPGWYGSIAAAQGAWINWYQKQVCQTATVKCTIQVRQDATFTTSNTAVMSYCMRGSRLEDYFTASGVHATRWVAFENYCVGPNPPTVTVYRRANTTQSLVCPATQMPDGCWGNKSADEFGDVVASAPPAVKPKLPPLVDVVSNAGGDFDADGGIHTSGPDSVPGGRVGQHSNPDGSNTVIDRTWDIGYPPGYSNEPGWTLTPKDTSTTYPPNTPVPPYDPGTPPVVPPGGSQSTTVVQNDIVTCGLPGTPACKIDETGTPPPDVKNPEADATGVWSALKTCVLSPSTCVPALPSLNWGFSLPSSCSAIETPAFAPYMTSIDVCQYQPIFHDLMSMLWVGTGLFTAVSMVIRDARGGS